MPSPSPYDAGADRSRNAPWRKEVRDFFCLYCGASFRMASESRADVAAPGYCSTTCKDKTVKLMDWRRAGQQNA